MPSQALSDKAARDARDATQTSVAARVVQKDMEGGTHTSETVAAYAIKAMENGDLYSIPQPLYQLFWVAKRLMPNSFYKVVGWMYRNKLGLFNQ